MTRSVSLSVDTLACLAPSPAPTLPPASRDCSPRGAKVVNGGWGFLLPRHFNWIVFFFGCPLHSTGRGVGSVARTARTENHRAGISAGAHGWTNSVDDLAAVFRQEKPRDSRQSSNEQRRNSVKIDSFVRRIVRRTVVAKQTSDATKNETV